MFVLIFHQIYFSLNEESSFRYKNKENPHFKNEEYLHFRKSKTVSASYE